MATPNDPEIPQNSNPQSSSNNLMDDAIHYDTLDPPRSPGERSRDALLRMLDRPVVQIIGIFVLLLIIADGALFFFLLMGWQRLCRPRTDCEPRNTVYNISIQILNGLFTYSNLVSMPWRCTNFLHLTVSCPRRSNAVGCNLYGIPDASDIWWYLPRSHRRGITVLLLLNAIFQFVNQGTRIVYYDYESQDTAPGNIWTNVFFAASFACAGIAGAWMGVIAHRVRQQFPGKFGPGPLETLRNLLRREDPEEPLVQESIGDPTREAQRRSVLPHGHRSSLRMWGM